SHVLWLAKMATPYRVTIEGLRGPTLGMANNFSVGAARGGWHKPHLEGHIQQDAARVWLVPHLEGCSFKCQRH
ncbi:hypothetical protein J1N35_014322, partial [Gossypium stocksii]